MLFSQFGEFQDDCLLDSINVSVLKCGGVLRWYRRESLFLDKYNELCGGKHRDSGNLLSIVGKIGTHAGEWGDRSVWRTLPGWWA